MTNRTRLLLPVLLALVLAGSVLLLPVPALADSLPWTQTYFGPLDRPNYPNADIPIAGSLNSVAFLDGSHGWAVGKVLVGNYSSSAGTPSGLLAYTSDGGSSWTTATAGSYELWAVASVSATSAVAVGDSGVITRWSEGTGWSTPQRVSGWPASYRLNGVAFLDAAHGFAVGDGGGIVRTTNGGDTWSILRAPTSTGIRLRAIVPVGTALCVAVGDSGKVCRITSGGALYSASSGTAANLYGVTFSDASHGWAVGDGPMLRVTADAGRSWASGGTLPLPAGASESSRYEYKGRAVAFLDPLTGVIAGTKQTVWRTRNGGVSWTAERLSDSGTLGDLEMRSIAFVPGTDGVAIVVARRDARFSFAASPEYKARIYRAAWQGLDDPVTSSNAGAYSAYVNPASGIVLSARSRATGATLASVHYSIDGAASVDFPVATGATIATVRLPSIYGVGTHRIEFRSTDSLGHQEATQTASITVLNRPSSSGTPTTPTFMSLNVFAGIRFTTYGYVIYHTPGTAPVTLYFYRYVSRKWVLYKSALARVSTVSVPGPDFSQYSYTASLPYKGQWRVRARHYYKSVYRYSSYRTFTVY